MALPALALCGWLGTLLLFWPGIVTFDGVYQYEQALSGAVEDWHPPLMARIWGLAGAHGAGPMLVLQATLWWLGLGLLAGGLVRSRRGRAALAVLAIGVWPSFLGWIGVVVKDALMAAALVAAVGVVGRWRLAGRRLPWPAGVAAGVLLGLAILLRTNAVFAVVPLAAMLLPWRARWRVAAIVVAVPLVIVATPFINHGLLGATPTGVERTQAIYDLSAIAVRTGDGGATGLPPAAIATLRRHDCVRAFYWDPLGDGGVCEGATAAFRRPSSGALYRRLAGAIVRHPAAYAAHRLAHLNSTWRWWVPAGWPNAGPPGGTEPNGLGLGQPSRAASLWQRVALGLVETPFGWPVVTVAVALAALAAARERTGAGRDLAVALAVSALGLEASFPVLSIASDLRYHLWPTIATALAVLLLADRRIGPRVARIGGLGLAVVIMVGVLGRVI